MKTTIALERLRVLAKVPRQLIAVESERELFYRLAVLLGELFDGVAAHDLFIRHPTSGVLMPVGGRGLELLAELLGGMRTLTPAERAALEAAGRALIDRPVALPGGNGRPPMMAAPLVGAPGEAAEAAATNRARGGVIAATAAGLIVVQGELGAPDFSLADVDALENLATPFAVVLQRLRAEQLAPLARRMERELERARAVQRSFLPVPPAVRGVRVEAVYRPVGAVGGDFYDLIPGPDESLSAVIGSVATQPAPRAGQAPMEEGGLAAALRMARVSGDCRRLAQDEFAAGALLRKLNQTLFQHGLAGEQDVPRTVAAACVRLDPRGGRVTVATGGHVAPLVRRAKGGVEVLRPPPGPPLGLGYSERYGEERFAVGQGDVLFLFTDGVVTSLGLRNLAKLVAQPAPDAAVMCARLTAALDAASPGRAPADATILALELTPR